jgi:hypothetical protein
MSKLIEIDSTDSLSKKLKIPILICSAGETVPVLYCEAIVEVDSATHPQIVSLLACPSEMGRTYLCHRFGFEHYYEIHLTELASLRVKGESKDLGYLYAVEYVQESVIPLPK